MTTDLEKQFFDTFGIEPKEKCAKPLLKTTSGFCKAYENCVGCDYNDLKYPQITDRILLNLILIMNPYAPPVGNTMEEMKEQVLFWCIEFADELKHQVQALFSERGD